MHPGVKELQSVRQLVAQGQMVNGDYYNPKLAFATLPQSLQDSTYSL
jgi:hypothetical protein